jgi:uncharacterized protein (DUF427 family)
VRLQQAIVADSAKTIRILETSHPPVFYFSPGDIELGLLRPNPRKTFCEFKGIAIFWDVEAGSLVSNAGWSYPSPAAGFEAVEDWVAFYPSKLECTVDGEPVLPQAGDFYGGWITSEIRGPFKGGPGTSQW